MNTNNSSLTTFGIDPTGLKQAQIPDFLTIDHYQSSSQGLPSAQFAGFVEVAESFGQIASPKTTSLVDLQRLVELSVLPFVQNKFQELYERTDWAEILKVSFGDDVDLAEGRKLLSQLAAGKGILPVEVLETEDLKAQGAFGDDRVFLGDELVRSGDVQAIAQVVVEEIGHSLDRKINISDAAGDEGEIFADLVFDRPLDAMNLATLKAEDDRAVREISGQGLAVELSAFPIQGSIRAFYDGTPNLAQVLREPTTAEAYVAYGVWRQDFQGGVIIHSNVYGSHAVKGSILGFYQGQGAQNGALGVPLTEEIATSYGWRQDFQGGTVIHSPQYGSQLVKGSVGNYYRGLSEAQRNQLGAPYTPENSLGGGNWRQFFRGGTVEWKNNGTGEVKFTPYSIGLNGNVVNQVVLDKFNQANGWDTLGKPLNALQSYAGGLVQDFERGIIFQSAAGTFVARGVIGELYRFRFALTGLPTGDEVITSYGVRQNFGNKIVFSSPQFGTQVLLDNVANFYRGLADWQRDQLGAPYSSELSLVAGGFRQFFKGGTIEWKANGTGEVKHTSYPIGFNGSSVDNAFLLKFNAADGWNALGNPTGNVRSITGGSIQDFERGAVIQTSSGTFALDTYVSWWYRQDPSALGLPTGDKVAIAGGFKQEFEKGIVFGNSNNQTFILKDSFATYYRSLSTTQIQELGALTSNFVYVNNGTAQYFQNGALLNSPQFGLKLVNGSIGNYYIKGLSDSTRSILGVPYTAAISLVGGGLRQFFTGGTIDWKSNGTGDVRFSSFPIGSDNSTINTAFITKFNEADGWNTLGSPNGYVRSITGGSVQDFANGSIIQTSAGVFVLDNYINSTYKQDQAALGLPIGNKTVTASGFKQDFEKGIIFTTQNNQIFVLKDAFAVSYRGLTAAQSQELGVLTSNITNINGGTTQFFQNAAFINSAKFGFQISKGSLGNYYSKGLSDSTRYWLGVPYTAAIDLGSGNLRQFFTGGTIDWKANSTGEVRFSSFPIGSTGTSINTAFISKFNEIDGWSTLGSPSSNVRSITGGNIQDFSNGSIIQTGTGVFVLDNYINSAYKQEQAALGLPIGNKIATASGFRQEFEKGIIFINSYNQTFVLKDTFANYYRGLTAAQSQELGMLTSNIADVNGGKAQVFQNGAIVNSAQNGFQLLNGSLGSYYSKGLSDSSRYWLGTPYTTSLNLSGGNLRQFFTGGTIDWKANSTGEIRFTSYPIGSTGTSINSAFISKFNEADGWNTLGYPSSNVRSITGGSIQDFSNGSIIQTGTGVFTVDSYINSTYKQEQTALGLPTGNKISTTNGFRQEFEKGIIFINPSNQTFVLKDSFANYYRGLTAAQSQELGVLTSNVANVNGGTAQIFQNGAIVNSAQNGFQLLNGSLGNYYSKGLSDSSRYWLGTPYTASISLGNGDLRQFFTGGTIDWKTSGTGELRYTSYPIGSTGTSINAAFISKFNEVDGWNTLGYPSSNVRSITGGSIQDFSNGSIIQTGAGVFTVDSYINSTYKQEQTALGLPTGNKISTTNGFRQEFEKGIIFINSYNQTFVLKDSFANYYRGLTAAQSQELGVLTSNVANVNGGTAQIFQNGAIVNSAQNGFQLLNGSLGNYYSKGLSDSSRYWLGTPYTASISLGNGDLRQFFTGGTIDWKTSGTGELRYTSYPIGSTGTSINAAFISKFNEVDGWNTLGYPSSNVRSITGGSIQDFSNGSIIQTGAGVFTVDSYINSTYKQEQTALGLPTGNKISTTNGFRQEFEKGIIFINSYNQTFVLKDSFANYYRGLTAAQSQELGVLTSNIANVNGGTAQVFQNGAIVNSAQNGFQLLNGSLGSYYSTGLSDSSRYWLGTPYTASISLSSGNLRQFFTGGTIDWKANGTGEIRYTNYPIGSTGTSINTAFISKFNEVDGWTTLGSPSSNVRSITGGNIQDFSYGTIIQTNAGVFTLDSSTTWWYRQDPNALGLPIGNKVSITGGFKQEFEKGIIVANSGNQTFILKDSFATYYRGLSTAQIQELGILTSNFSYVNGGKAQYFQNGAVYQSAAGTFAVRGEIYKQFSSRSSIGTPTSDQKVTSYGLRQDFTEGSIFYAPQLGNKVIDGALGKYYQSLTEDQKTKLGTTYGEQYYYGNNSSFRLFQGGALELNRNGVNQVRLSTASVGFDGTVLNDKFINKFLAAGNFDGFGDPVTNIVSSNGILRQDFTKGSIIQSGTNIFSVDGLIGDMYRQNGSSLGLPTSDKVATTSGFRQEFQNGIFISVTATSQVFALKNTIADYYRGLASNQLQELGNPLSDATEVKGGFIHYFQNGAIYQSTAGVFRVRGEIGKLVTGRGLPGVAIGEEKVTSYGVRQDFTEGTVIYSAQTGAKTIDGALGKYYQSLTEIQKDQLGVTYGEQLYYGNNSSLRLFRGGVIELNQNGVNQVRFFANAVGFDGNGFSERFINKFFAARYFEGLGDPTSAVVNSNGVLRQDFQKGSIVQSDAGLFVIDSKLVQTYTQNISSLGAPIGDTTVTSSGLRQDFQKGIIFQSGAGTFVVDGLIADMYRFRFTSFGTPIGNKISTVHGIRQDFQNGTLVATPATSQTFAFTDSIGEFYRGLNDTQLQALGKPLSSAENVTGGVRQYFQNGSIDKSSAGIFIVKGEIGKRIYGQGVPGVAIGAETATSYGLRQDFSAGTVMYSSRNGVNVIDGSLGDYYQGLTEEQKLKLGETYGPLYGYGNSSFYRFFYGGIVDYNRNGVNQVRFTNGSAVGFNGNSVDDRFVAQYISAGNLDTLGDPITNVLNINGTLRQDFQKGYIVQNGYTIESRLYNGTPLATSNIPQPVTGGGVINVTFGNAFPIKGSVGDYYYNKISADQRQHLGQPTEAEVFLGNGLEWRQNFQNGTIFHGAKGSYIVQNSLRNIYNNELNAGDRQRLGMPIGNEIFSDHWYQVFEHGELQLVSNNPVRWTDGGNAQVSQTTGVRVGFDGNSAHNTYINTFNRSGGGAGIGSATNNVHVWANGYAQDFQGGNEGRGAILKSHANDNSYWVGGSFWNAYLATNHGADGALGYPTSDRIGNRQNFQNGALISGSNGVFAVYGGIGSHYLNSEGGENGRLGAPTSGEQGIGGGKIVQHFQNGDILHGSGATSTLLTVGGAAINYVNEFTAVVMPGIGVALRNTPRESDRSGIGRNFNDTIPFDAWTTGDTLIDTRLGTPDNKWYHIKGTNYWVPSAYVNGDPGRSVVGENTTSVNAQTVNTPQNLSGGNYSNSGGGVNNSGDLSLPSNQSSGGAQQNTSSVVFVSPGRISQQINFDIQNQSIEGSGNKLPRDYYYSPGFNEKWGNEWIDFGIKAGVDIGIFATPGSFNINLPTAFDINWKSAQDGKSIDIDFSSQLSSPVGFSTIFGFGASLNLGIEASLTTKFPLFSETRKIEASAGIDLDSILSDYNSPFVIDASLNANGRKVLTKPNTFVAEDDGFIGFSLINVIALFAPSPASVAAAIAARNLGIEVNAGVRITQESELEIIGFDIDPDGIDNKNNDQLFLGGSKTFNLSIPVGKEFRFSPTVRPIVKFKSLLKTDISLEGGIDLEEKFKIPVKFTKAIDVPVGDPWIGAIFNPFNFTNVTKLQEITVKLS